MRLNSTRFIPGIRIEVLEEKTEEKDGILDVAIDNGKSDLDFRQKDSVTDGNAEVGNGLPFNGHGTREGTDWESVNYQIEKIACDQDEVTGLEVTQKYIIAQYHVDPSIDIFDRESKSFLFRLSGHEYGGQCIKVSESSGLLYSASLDFSLRVWNIESKTNLDSATDHCDYINAIALYSDQSCDKIATGGRGDKLIFIYHSSTTGKLEKQLKLEGHQGWITQLIMSGHSDGLQLISGSEDATIRVWNLDTGELIQMLEQDAGISCISELKLRRFRQRLFLFGDQEGKLSYLDMESGDVIHILPNILIGTGRYCRSSKYHDKAVDYAHITDNGYLITASAGSRFVKIWKFKHGDDLAKTEVKELQILRDHTDYLSALKVYNGTIFSSCSDGNIYLQQFPPEGSAPHYEMADCDETSASVLLSAQSRSMAVDPEHSTETCEGPKRCKTGKTGIVKSSSSFQVSFQLKPSTCSVDSKIRIPMTLGETIFEEDEWEPSQDSDVDSDYEIVYVTDDEDEEDF